MPKDLEEAVSKACQKLFDIREEAEISRTEEKFGDYSTNVALKLSAQLGKNPREIAESLKDELESLEQVKKAEVAGPGFINLTLTDKALWGLAQVKANKPLAGQEVLVEFGDPNPFKEMHIGHLYSYVVGDAICRLFESAGANVKRLSYHGDVGLHVAKAIWAMQKEGYEESKDIGWYYAKGAQAYEKDESAKSEIDELNQKIYQNDESISQLYEQGRKRSFASFDQTLSELGIKTDKRYLESQSAPQGQEMVKANVGKIFKESQGAIVYEGEKAGLHTRVFITSRGLPTYEAKDLGLVKLKDQDYPDAKSSVIITANEQAEYFKVMLAALAEIGPALAKKTKHISHGFVSLSTGKMSSRTGEVYGAVDLLQDVEKTAQKLYPDADKDVQLGAVKYEFLKHRLGADIAYDVEESVGLQGNSGPYLQYAHARACSILSKASSEAEGEGELEPAERSLLRKIGQFNEAVAKATNELMPHHICTYLYELAQSFNSFYETSRIIDDPREHLRLGLVELYREVLNEGLNLLGIQAPQKM